MIITPVPHGLEGIVGVSTGPRSPGLHMSAIYNDLFQDLEPKRFQKGSVPNPLMLEAGLALENMLEEGLRQRLCGERPPEQVTAEGIFYSPDLIIFNGHTRLGEIKLTWMSSKEVPREVSNGFPSQFDKYFVQMKAYCVAPSTRVLTRDLRWVEAETLRAGDCLFAFDEFPTSLNGRRRWKFATVEQNSLVRKPCYRMIFADGTEVVCSDDHQWLGRTGLSSPRWLTPSAYYRYDNLRIAKPFDVWYPKNTFTDGYLSGIADGEGNLHLSKGLFRGVHLSQKPGVVLNKIEHGLKQDGWDFSIFPPNSQGVSRANVYGFHQGVTFLGRYRPERLLQNFQRLTLFPATGFGREIPVVACEFWGEQWVSAIQTDARTFIAEGFASHNCYHLELAHARLLAFFINGNYRHTGPELLAWDIEFTKRELDENWRMLKNHAISKGML